MNIKYVGENFVINCQAHSIQTSNGQIDIRPKTFELLLLLIEHTDQVVTKQQLLDTIWDDVNVEEHVIVQSIAELRKAFGTQKVIQTHPRKGYSWISPIEKQPIANGSRVTNSHLESETTAHITAPPTHTLITRKAFLGMIIIISLLILLGVFLNHQNKIHTSAANNGTIYILPTKNNMMDSKFDWVSLGIMDSLISQAEDNSNIMPVDFVLSSMQLAKMGRDYNDEQVARLIKITGSHIIVESEISRRLGEYQLMYRLHQANNIKRGVIFNKSLDDLIIDFAGVISEIADLNPQGIVVKQSSFNHEMFVEAISLSKNGKLESAILLLKSLLSIEPDNFHAYRLLIDWLQYQQDFQQALEYSSKALSELSEQTNKASFYYRHGYNLFRLKRLNEAWQYSQQLDQQLMVENNPFYLGFAGQLKGEILIAQNHPEKAKMALLHSLKQFEQISYSIGLTTVHILLSQVEGQLGNEQQQQKHQQYAQDVVKKYEIQALIKLFLIDLDPL